jgi:hypothetical protein
VVEALVDLAGALVDGFGTIVVEDLIGERGDLARESLAIDPDQRREPLPIGRETYLLEHREPALDARLDSVDEGAVEIEDHGMRPR